MDLSRIYIIGALIVFFIFCSYMDTKEELKLQAKKEVEDERGKIDATLARVLSFCFKDGKTTITEDCEKEIVTLADYVTDDDEEERKDEQIIKKTLSGLAKSLVNMIKL